ncbi:MAG: hypothetical protein Q8928_04765 [Bacteroidota bacterium]|nr:hypothetical protein [Bacteroidota bacterium]
MENKKELKKKILDLINQGNSKQVIFNELKMTYRNQIDLAKLISQFPTLENKKKYSSTNTTLIVLLSIALLFDIVGLSFVAIFLDIVLLYVVATFQVNYYQWITFRAGFSAVFLIIIMIFAKFTTLDMIACFISLLILIPTVIIANKLEKKLCPDFEQKKIQTTNENGKPIFRLQFIFKD